MFGQVKLSKSATLTMGSISSTFYKQLLQAQIPKAQKTVKLSVFLNFWDLCMQKLLVEYWWNWHLQSISSTFCTSIICTKVCSKPKRNEKKRLLYKKCAQKTLTKLTPGQTFSGPRRGHVVARGGDQPRRVLFTPSGVHVTIF